METWQIVIAVIMAVNGFWSFLIVCVMSSINKNIEQMGTAIIVWIGTDINKLKGETNNDTTGKQDS